MDEPKSIGDDPWMKGSKNCAALSIDGGCPSKAVRMGSLGDTSRLEKMLVPHR